MRLRWRGKDLTMVQLLHLEGVDRWRTEGRSLRQACSGGRKTGRPCW